MVSIAKKALVVHWKRTLLIAILGFVGFAFASVEITSTPKFCGSCHIMGPYYDSWTTDAHSNVSCVECHIPPGATNYFQAKLNGLGQVVDDLLNRTSTKPSASVSNFSCLRSGCHAQAKLDEKRSPDLPFKFRHDKHLEFTYEGIEVQCTTCHSHIKGDKHFEVSTNVCVTCHLADQYAAWMASSHSMALPAATPTVASASAPAAPASGSASGSPHASGIGSSSASASGHAALKAPTNCDACHDAPHEPIKYQGLEIDHNEYLRFGAQCMSCHRNATAKPPVISDSQCVSCHTFGMERFTNAEDMHRVHAEGKHKVECFSCHGLIEHGPEAQAMSLEQFDCQKCHQNQHMIQRAAYTNNSVVDGAVSDKDGTAISPMFLVHVDCTGCHIKPSSISVKPTSGASVLKAVPEACDACHQPGFGAQLVPMWQRNTHELYDGVMALMPTPEDPWADGSLKATELVRDAERLLELVRVDGSWGVHNPTYTKQVIEQAQSKMVEARKLSRVDGNAKP